MNDTSNPNPSQPRGESQPEGAADPKPSQPGRCVLVPLCAAVNDGASKAKATAEKAIPKIKAAVSGATYWAGYGASFATVFSYTVARELTPEALKAGCRAGAQAGRKTAEDLAAKWRERSSAPVAAPSPCVDPSGTATQPGMA